MLKHEAKILFANDTVALIASVFFALWIRTQFGPIIFSYKVIPVVVVVFLFLAYIRGLYKVSFASISIRIVDILMTIGLWAGFVAIISYVVKYQFSRGVFVLSIVCTTVFIVLGRMCVVYIKKKKLKKTELYAVIIGEGSRATYVYGGIISRFPHAHVRQVPIEKFNLAQVPNLGVYFVQENYPHEKLLEFITDPQYKHIDFKIVADVFHLVVGNMPIRNIDDIPTMSVYNEPHALYEIIKRGIDICGAVCLLVLTFPIWVLFPLLIKQERVGYRGKKFYMWKFRTMKPDTDLYKEAPKSEDDERITKIGKVLRRLSLDELPQLINILTGDMSLIGPRPEMAFIVDTYTPWQKIRLNAKPGLTGLWQILGRKDIPLRENLEYDVYYINNRSIPFDLIILIKTIPVVLFGKGAY